MKTTVALLASCQFPSWSPNVPLAVTVWCDHNDELTPLVQWFDGHCDELIPLGATVRVVNMMN